MKKITKIPDDWGQNVIYVRECDKYEYEIQPDMPYLNNRESKHKIEKIENSRISDILIKAENYFNNSGK